MVEATPSAVLSGAIKFPSSPRPLHKQCICGTGGHSTHDFLGSSNDVYIDRICALDRWERTPLGTLIHILLHLVGASSTYVVLPRCLGKQFGR